MTVPAFTAAFAPSPSFTRTLVKNINMISVQNNNAANAVQHSSLCTCPSCMQVSHRLGCACNACSPLSSKMCKAGCSCLACGMKTLLRMSESDETEAPAVVEEDIPAEVASLDGIESADEAHNAARPARAAINKSRGGSRARGKPLSEIVIGSTIEGTIKSTTSYGAFVNIGFSSDALLHVSRMSDEFVSNVEDIVKTGDTVTVRVLSVDAEKNQVAVTMRSEEAEAAAASGGQRQQRPQGRARTDRSAQAASLTALADSGFDDAKFFEGEVVSTLAFGAFVRFDLATVSEGLAGTLEGLVHISALAEQRTESVESVCKTGDKVQVRVRSVDVDNGRVSLAMVTKDAEQASNERRRGGGGGFDGGGDSLYEAHEMGAADWAESTTAVNGDLSFNNAPMIIRK
eukprot:CAMPEP_0194356094 /NCGR_PEP_ID=MMETSP0174-20130528/3872_1 /TAXON_ID=216777 /ORGANISM="Proboscia alata, Strain PI-D3" /LENGTH=401 /DNA_ID=CAMNT_0039125603 /DNA_START=120 /DNA_END=1325 /DNA_ORIENTATION=-